MSEMLPAPREHEQRLEQVLADYLHSIEAGQPLDRQQLLARHPDLAGALASFFRNRDALERPTEPPQGRAEQCASTLPPEPSAATDVGTVVRSFGDYALLEEIARGGMGIVYRARHLALNRIVALKMILAGQLASPTEVQRFRNESEAVARLDHPNIVPIYEVGEHQGQPYFTMKFMEGGSLGQHLSRFPANPRAAAEVLAAVAHALQHAHQRGILHRDLKPANILLDGEGRPHVTDFGLAKALGREVSMTQSGAIVGTPNYMAPEQASGQKNAVTTASDVFSLGAVLYELLTGRPAFQGATLLDTLHQVLEKEPARPRGLNLRVDRNLETICLKCLEKEPEQRYHSAEALAQDLEHWLANEPIKARQRTAWERMSHWAQRRRAAPLLVLLFVIANAAPALFPAWILERNLTEQYENKGKVFANVIAGASVEYLLFRDPTTIQAMIDQYLEEGKIQGVAYLFVVDQQGAVISHTFAPGIPDEVRRLEGDRHETTVHPVRIAGRDFIDFASPILAGELGSVHVGMDLELIRHAIRSAIIKQLVLLSPLFVLSMWVTYLLLQSDQGRPKKSRPATAPWPTR